MPYGWHLDQPRAQQPGKTQVQFHNETILLVLYLNMLHLRHSMEKEMANHSSILAWEIPWTEEPGGLQSMGWQKEPNRT